MEKMSLYNTVLESLRKSIDTSTSIDVEENDIKTKPQESTSASELISAKSIIDDPYYDFYVRQNFYKQKASRLSNTMLKSISVRDWLVSAILQIRCDTVGLFGRPQENVFDTGYKIEKRNPADKTYTKEDMDEVNFLENFILNCGYTENTPQEDKRTFSTYLKLETRDILTFGYLSTEKVFMKNKRLHRFRPVPAENTYLIDKKQTKDSVESYMNSVSPMYTPRKGSNDPAAEYKHYNQDIEYYKYVQTSADLRPLRAFGDEDLIFELFNPQNFVDSGGYCYGLLELAILNVMNHMKLDQWNSNFFTHGYAARGILNLQGNVSQGQLRSFREQFYNSITGSQNAWRTPIIAGIDKVEWVPMSQSAKDMEYLNFNNMIMRSICSQFQIDPMELGLDYLVSANGRTPSQQANNKFKIEYSKERGLYPILHFFEDVINYRILPAIDKDLAKKYRFVFKGYTDETPQTKVALQQAQIGLFKSINDIRSENRMSLIDEPLANIPLNAAYIGLLEKMYTRGEMREKFLNDKDASKNKSLQYIPGDNNFIQWNQLVFSKANQDDMLRQQKRQEEEQKKQMEEQQEQEAQQAQTEEAAPPEGGVPPEEEK